MSESFNPSKSRDGRSATWTGVNETGRNTTFYSKNLNLDAPCLKRSEGHTDVAYLTTPVDLFGEIADMR